MDLTIELSNSKSCEIFSLHHVNPLVGEFSTSPRNLQRKCKNLITAVSNKQGCRVDCTSRNCNTIMREVKWNLRPNITVTNYDFSCCHLSLSLGYGCVITLTREMCVVQILFTCCDVVSTFGLNRGGVVSVFLGLG